MKTITALVLAILFASTSAFGADAAPKATSKSQASTSASAATKTDSRTAAGPVRMRTSQQERMRECNKSAVGKKGAERKAFMKSCLSTRKT